MFLRVYFRVRINYLSFDSLSEGVGASQVLNLVEAYRNLDQQVNLVTFEKVQPQSHLKDRISSAGISWTPIAFGRTGAIGGLTRIRTLIRNIPQGDVTHARGDLPAFSGLMGSTSPLLWDVRSLWVEQRKLMNPAEFNAIVEIILRKMNGYVSANCAAYTTLTNAIMPELISRYPNLPTLQKTIPTCVDLSKFEVSSFAWNTTLQFLLLGNFNQLYDTLWMKKLLLKLQSIESIEVLWARDYNLKHQLNPLSIFNQTSVLHSEVPNLIRRSHVGVLLLKNPHDLSLKASMPTKIAEFWASGRPIIISKGVGDVDSINQEYGVGLSIDESMEAPEILENLRTLIADPYTPERCRFVAEKYFDIQIAAKNYLRLFHQITT